MYKDTYFSDKFTFFVYKVFFKIENQVTTDVKKQIIR